MNTYLPVKKSKEETLKQFYTSYKSTYTMTIVVTIVYIVVINLYDSDIIHKAQKEQNTIEIPPPVS